MIHVGQDEFNEIVSLLIPHVRTGADRTALITPLFSSRPTLYERIEWTGDARAFSAGLTELLLSHGDVAAGRPALLVLLEGLQRSVGVDVQQRIDALIDRLDAPPPFEAHRADREIEVFLCYSSQDRPMAQAVRAALVEAGVSVWQDVDRIQAGAYFSIEIQQAIRRADVVVVLVTKAATESLWVHNEVTFAVDVQKPIIPLLLQADVTKMMQIYSLQHIHMVADWRTGLDTLVQRLRQLEPAAPRAVPAIEPAPLPHVGAAVTAQEPRTDGDPFVYGTAVPPGMFVGRAAVLEEVRNRVGHYSTLQSLSIVANRRMGKTSLLRYINHNCGALFTSDYDYAAVYVDAMDPRARTCAGFMRLLRRNTRRQLERELWPEMDDGRLAILNECLEELALYDRVRLVLLLDEWESVMAYQELDALIDALRVCGSMGMIGMITATAHRLTDLKEQGKLTSPFPNIFKTVYLGNLPPGEWREVVRQGLARVGREAEESDYALVGELAGGHPYLTQLAGSLIWQAKHKDWDKAAIRSAFAQQARMIFSGIWQRLSPEQIRAVRVALGLTEPAQVADNVLTDLTSRGVLTEAGDVFCRPFADFARQELERQP